LVGPRRRHAWVVGLLLLGCSPAGRDVVPESRDLRVTPDAAAPPSKDGYAYVARRPHGAVGLVGAHFMTDPEAQRVADRVADELETCARRLQQRGDLVEGAVTLVAITGSRGTAEVTDIRFAPGGPVAANALECIVAPLRAGPLLVRAGRPLQATNAEVPAVAIEATWGPIRDGISDAGVDGSGPL